MLQLEELSNKELRKKCLEYGLPNVPITNTSRKLLLRRLEAAMSGKPITTDSPKKSNRRETMHVANPSESLLSTQVDNTTTATLNRASRRTIAVPSNRIVTTTTTVSEPETSDTSPERIADATLAAKNLNSPRGLYPKLPLKEPSPKPIQLSASEVVTTSYIQESKNANQHINNINYKTDLNASQGHFNKPATNYTTSQPNISSVHKTLNYNSQMRPQIDTSTKPFCTLTSNFKTTSTPDYLIEDCEDETDEDDIDISENSLNTPYLSQFARNLETLKATPIGLESSLKPPMHSSKVYDSATLANLRNRESIRNRYISTAIAPRRSIQNSTRNTTDSSVRRFFMDLDDKYNLKYSFMVISILVFAIFFYVFFIQSI